jgi:hypothetical protein
MTVTASGKLLTPYLIFKGTPNGRIEKREFPSFSNALLYSVQKAAWMDERCMLLWVEKVLKPYVDSAPDGIVPLLFLDSYRCHMMNTVVHKIQELGVEVEHIPGGCTSLCQPVDIGVNKPFKNRLRERWETWMMIDGLLLGTTAPPPRETITEWVEEACLDMSEELLQNAWLHHDYSFFPSSLPSLPTVADVGKDNDDGNNDPADYDSDETSLLQADLQRSVANVCCFFMWLNMGNIVIILCFSCLFCTKIDIGMQTLERRWRYDFGHANDSCFTATLQSMMFLPFGRAL